jgi:amino acid permease
MTPMMIQKDISGIAKFAFLGIYSIIFLFVALLILLIFKIKQSDISPLEANMLYSSGDFSRKFKSFGSYLNAFVFQVNFFPIYLPLHPRSSKNMMKASIFGATLSMIIYSSFGIIGFIIYRYNINDTLLIYLGDDLIKYLKTNKIIATLLILFELAFISNTSISIMLNFFIGKSGLIAFIKFILKYKKKKNKNNNREDIPLVDVDEKGVALDTKNDKDKEKDILTETCKTLITLFAYIVVVFVSFASESIISIDNFNGSTINNYLSVMLPALFFIILSRDKGFSFEKCLAVFICIFSLCLIIGFLLINFCNIFR